MENKEMKKIIDEYIKSYNKFDVEGMVSNLHEDVEFKNISGGELNLELNGKNAFKKQARESVKMFKKREMKVKEERYEDNRAEIKIDFMGVLAMDIPKGPKSGKIIKIKGKSIYSFKDRKIISIEDIS